MLKHAINYQKLGWSVIPLQGKRPIQKWKFFNSQPASEEDINYWWNKNKSYNIGIVTGLVSNLVVIDADSEELVNYVYDNTNHTNLITPTSRTHRGKHFYFTHPGYYIPTRYINGLEIRSERSYIVAPPSVHPKSKEVYEWIIAPSEVELKPCPEWVLSLVNSTKTNLLPVKSLQQIPVELNSEVPKPILDHMNSSNFYADHFDRSKHDFILALMGLEHGLSKNNIAYLLSINPKGKVKQRYDKVSYIQAIIHQAELTLSSNYQGSTSTGISTSRYLSTSTNSTKCTNCTNINLSTYIYVLKYLSKTFLVNKGFTYKERLRLFSKTLLSKKGPTSFHCKMFFFENKEIRKEVLKLLSKGATKLVLLMACREKNDGSICAPFSHAREIFGMHFNTYQKAIQELMLKGVIDKVKEVRGKFGNYYSVWKFGEEFSKNYTLEDLVSIGLIDHYQDSG